MNMNNTNAKKAYIIKSKMRFVTFLILLFISLFTLTNIIFINNDIAFGESAYKTSYENFDGDSYIIYEVHSTQIGRRRVGKECRSRWSPYH